MATDERDLDRSPTPSTSLLPVVGACRKLNGRRVWSASDDDVAETSFIVSRGNGTISQVPAASLAATGSSSDDACFPAPSSSALVRDGIGMTQVSAAATAAVNHVNQFYVDTKGTGSDSGSVSRNIQHGTSCEAGPCTPTSLFATDSRSTYARVADNCSLPPEVEQLRHECVTFAPSSSDEHHTADKFV